MLLHLSLIVKFFAGAMKAAIPSIAMGLTATLAAFESQQARSGKRGGANNAQAAARKAAGEIVIPPKAEVSIYLLCAILVYVSRAFHTRAITACCNSIRTLLQQHPNSPRESRLSANFPLK